MFSVRTLSAIALSLGLFASALPTPTAAPVSVAARGGDGPICDPLLTLDADILAIIKLGGDDLLAKIIAKIDATVNVLDGHHGRGLIDVDADVDADVDVNLRGLIDVDADIDADVDVNLRGLIDVDADIDADIDVNLRGLIDVDADVDADVDVNLRGLIDVDADVDADVDVNERGGHEGGHNLLNLDIDAVIKAIVNLTGHKGDLLNLDIDAVVKALLNLRRRALIDVDADVDAVVDVDLRGGHPHEHDDLISVIIKLLLDIKIGEKKASGGDIAVVDEHFGQLLDKVGGHHGLVQDLLDLVAEILHGLLH